jgi:hypothetical protein
MRSPRTSRRGRGHKRTGIGGSGEAPERHTSQPVNTRPAAKKKARESVTEVPIRIAIGGYLTGRNMGNCIE